MIVLSIDTQNIYITSGLYIHHTLNVSLHYQWRNFSQTLAGLTFLSRRPRPLAGGDSRALSRPPASQLGSQTQPCCALLFGYCTARGSYTTLWFIINCNRAYVFQNDAIFLHSYFTRYVATCLKRGGIFKHEFVANLLPSRLVKKFWKWDKLVKLWPRVWCLVFLTHGVV